MGLLNLLDHCLVVNYFSYFVVYFSYFVRLVNVIHVNVDDQNYDLFWLCYDLWSMS